MHFVLRGWRRKVFPEPRFQLLPPVRCLRLLSMPDGIGIILRLPRLRHPYEVDRCRVGRLAQDPQQGLHVERIRSHQQPGRLHDACSTRARRCSFETGASSFMGMVSSSSMAGTERLCPPPANNVRKDTRGHMLSSGKYRPAHLLIKTPLSGGCNGSSQKKAARKRAASGKSGLPAEFRESNGRLAAAPRGRMYRLPAFPVHLRA